MAGDNTIDPSYRARVLDRPISMAVIQTMDWDELSHLAGVADEAATPRDEDADSPRARGIYARGVRDALIWIAAGVPSDDLLEVLEE